MAGGSPRRPGAGEPDESPAGTAAQRLWRGALVPPAGTADVALAADQLCQRLRIGLGRWLGVEGYRALLGRALTAARHDHAVLAAWECLGGDPPSAQAALKAHGAEAVEAGTRALVMALVELLGSIMGKEMAVHLVEQAGRTGFHDSRQSASEDGSHG